jgi:hypothetical protein
MKHIWFLIALCLTVNAGFAGADQLEEGFKTPPDSAKPQVWWHWINGNITKEGITADLEAMKRVGIGGAQIFNIPMGIARGDVPVLSPAWYDCVKYADREAKRLGLELSIQVGPGWSIGGKWMKPEEGMKILTWSKKTVRGPMKFEGRLETPPYTNFYRDIAVYAVPAADGESKSLAERGVTVTSDPPIDGLQNIIDNNSSTGVTLPVSLLTKGSITFSFPQAVSIQSVTVMYKQEIQGSQIIFEASEDGVKYQTIATGLEGEYSELHYPQSILACKPNTARFFRIRYKAGKAPVPLLVQEINLSPAPRIHLADLKSGSTRVWGHGTSQKYIDDKMTGLPGIPRTRVIDLSKNLNPQGVLAWDIPEGEWTIVRIGYTPNGRVPAASPRELFGPVVDLLDPKGMDAHFQRYLDPILTSGGTRTEAMKYILMDSFEPGCQNWTEILPEEFKKRRGYDLEPWLPVLAGGYVLENGDASERFLRDVRKTLAELIAENFYGRARELCHERGLKLNAESSGAMQYLYDPLNMQRHNDMPMGESWTSAGGKLGAARADNKVASSVAHTLNLPFAASETFTGEDRWLGHPFSAKYLSDETFCLGINKLIVHRFAHQARLDIAPGFTLGRWGFSYDRTQTWWEQSSEWISYITRCQYLLSQGRFAADILCLTAEDAPSKLYELDPRNEFKPAIPSGYDYDGCPDDVFMNSLSVSNGYLTLPHGMRYRVLLLPDTTVMTPERARMVKRLVAEGATVVGRKPTGSPSLTGFPAADAEVRKIADEVWGADGTKDHFYGKGCVRTGSFEEIFSRMNIAPDFESSIAQKKNEGIRYIHRVDGETEIYFLANKSERAADAVCTFRVSGKSPEFWRPDTGRIEQCGIFTATNGQIRMPIHFDPFGSVFVIFRKPAAPAVSAVKYNGKELFSGKAPGKESPAVAAQAGSFNDVVCFKEQGALKAEICRSGTYELSTDRGSLTFAVTLPDPLVIGGAWDVSFPPDRGAPEKATFDSLVSWSERAEPGIKYFSGTATYTKEIVIPQELIAADRKLYLDLGNVQVIAEVNLNGKELGILWKPPFRADITAVAKPGMNKLTVRVVNLWPNRLIGDEQLPEDAEYGTGASTPLLKWPEWLLQKKPRESGRIALGTWKHWKKDDALQPSGLIGPVRIVPAQSKVISE